MGEMAIAALAITAASAGYGGYQQRKARKETEKQQEKQQKRALMTRKRQSENSGPGALRIGRDEEVQRQRGLGARKLTIPLGGTGGNEGGPSTGVNVPR